MEETCPTGHGITIFCDICTVYLYCMLLDCYCEAVSLDILCGCLFVVVDGGWQLVRDLQAVF